MNGEPMPRHPPGPSGQRDKSKSYDGGGKAKPCLQWGKVAVIVPTFFIAGCGKYTSINEPYTAGPDMDGSHGVPEDRLVLILMQITPEGEEKNGRI